MSRPTIPGYQLLEELGAGASGVVYRATQLDLGREVALKVLSPGLFDEEETAARFLREARLQARLTHPNLVQLLDAGIAGSRPYLAAELVSGGTVRGLLDRDGRLAPPRAVGLVLQAAVGLGAAHEAGIIHRDLKPENLLLTAEGQVKVADFGLAKGLEGRQTLQTAADKIMGTPGYLAPELLLGQPATPAADVYALGVILFELIAGQRPVAGSDLANLLDQTLHAVPQGLSVLVDDVPAELDDLVESCLRKEPEARPSSAQVLAERLAGLELRGARAAQPRKGRVSAAGEAVQLQKSSPLKAGQPATRAVSVRPGMGGAPTAVMEGEGGRARPPGDPKPARLAAIGAAALCLVLALTVWQAAARRPGGEGPSMGPAAAGGASEAVRTWRGLASSTTGARVARLWFDSPAPGPPGCSS